MHSLKNQAQHLRPYKPLLVLLRIYSYQKKIIEIKKAFENSKAFKFLEPSFFPYLVGLVEFFIAFGKIYDTFNKPDDTSYSASYNGNYNLNNSFLGVAQNKFMDAKSAQNYCENAGKNFLIFLVIRWSLIPV